MYGHARRWEPEQFKGNLQGFFFINNIFVITGHAINGNFTPEVWHNYLLALPALAVGIWGGLALGRKIDSNRFRQVVLGMLFILGVRLIWSG